MGTVPPTPLFTPLHPQGPTTGDENKALPGLGELGSSMSCASAKRSRDTRAGAGCRSCPHTLCCPQAGTGELHSKTGSCGEGLSSLMLLQWGEKGVKSRVGRDCPLSPWHAQPREAGVMCRMGVPVVPKCHLPPTWRDALQENAGESSPTWSILFTNSLSGITEAGAYFPHLTPFSFSASPHASTRSVIY